MELNLLNRTSLVVALKVVYSLSFSLIYKSILLGPPAQSTVSSPLALLDLNLTLLRMYLSPCATAKIRP